ncbi:MAG: YfaZ family outer membrane protein [Pseudomonadota bacterium]
MQKGVLWACAVLTVGLLAAPVQAETLDLSLNDDAVRLVFTSAETDRSLQFDGGWLHHQDNGDVVHAGMHLVGDASSGDEPLTGGLGGRIFFINPDAGDLDASALAIGGFLRYTFPDFDRINIYGHAYFAPDVITFGDGDNYTDIEIRGAYNVLRNADVFIGARYSKVEFDPVGEQIMDNGFHVGIQLRF